jgi:hypothetical protein
MGFRFSRRVSILPGLKLNVSGNGLSLSAGVRGAHINFGPRGTYASMGLPGTGLSYRQRIGGAGRSYSAPPAVTEEQIQGLGDRRNDDMAVKLYREGSQTLALNLEEAKRYLADPRFKFPDPQTGRRLTSAQMEARLRDTELKEKVHNLEIQLQAEAEEYEHLIDFWKPLPRISSVEDWNNALSRQPLESKLVPPPPLDLEREKAALLEELTAKHSTGLSKLLPAFVARTAALKELETVWPQRQAQLQQRDDEQRHQYEQQAAAESSAWDEAEAKRIDWLNKLLAGDLEEVHHTVAEVLQGLRFPFHTHCDYFLEDEQSVYLHVDLPEIEDVIPEMRKVVLKAGETRESRRPRDERNSDYERLVMGESLYLAAETFSYLPLAQTVRVAAYTQRPRVRERDPIDTYLLDVAFTQEAVIEFTQNEQNLTSFLTRLGGRFVLADDGSLGRIEPPSWLAQADLASTPRV